MFLRLIGRIVTVLAASVLTVSCTSLTYVEASGVRHVVGFANVTVTPSATKNGPSVVSVTTLGLAVRLASARQNGAVTLGYDKQTAVDLPANACVDLEAPGACAALANSAPPAIANHASGATQ
jgi:hypothetical protein